MWKSGHITDTSREFARFQKAVKEARLQIIEIQNELKKNQPDISQIS